MLTPQVTQILENGINTSCKLAIMLRFVDQPELRASASQIAARICRDIWSVEEALSELVEDGLLLRNDQIYSCVPCPEMREQLLMLRETYEYPLQRIELQGILHDLERYAPYRKELPRSLVISRVA